MQVNSVILMVKIVLFAMEVKGLDWGGGMELFMASCDLTPGPSPEGDGSSFAGI